MRTKAYRNLHNGKWSLLQKINGAWLVVAHCDELCLLNCDLTVSESGRQRVLKEQKKYVHAYVVGDLLWWRGETFKGRKPETIKECPWEYFPEARPRAITYNPYKYSSFVYKKTEEPVYEAEAVKFEYGFVYSL